MYPRALPCSADPMRRGRDASAARCACARSMEKPAAQRAGGFVQTRPNITANNKNEAARIAGRTGGRGVFFDMVNRATAAPGQCRLGGAQMTSGVFYLDAIFSA